MDKLLQYHSICILLSLQVVLIHCCKITLVAFLISILLDLLLRYRQYKYELSANVLFRNCSQISIQLLRQSFADTQSQSFALQGSIQVLVVYYFGEGLEKFSLLRQRHSDARVFDDDLKCPLLFIKLARDVDVAFIGIIESISY